MRPVFFLCIIVAGIALLAVLGEHSRFAVSAETAPAVMVERHDIRALPGKLNNIPVLNSNSPEVVQSEGILVSTFPPAGKSLPSAHLNVSFKGRFDIFAHHIAKSDVADQRILYLGVLLYNAGTRGARVNVLSGASYLSQPDAPFVALPGFVESEKADVYAGPGDRVTLDVLRDARSGIFPASFVVPAGKFCLLAGLPIPVQGLTPPLNGRSLLVQLHTDQSVYGATLAMFSTPNPDGTQRPPALEDWQKLLVQGQLAGPREKNPTALQTPGPVIYGRVGGVSKGTAWNAQLSDSDGFQQPCTALSGSKHLTIPSPDKPISYPISTVVGGTFGTEQVQSAPIVSREENTAYQAHGNYGIKYDIGVTLYNNQSEQRSVAVSLQTPQKQTTGHGALSFLQPPAPNVFFRGTVRLSFDDGAGSVQSKYIHLVEHRGERGLPLATLSLKPRESRRVRLEFLYPPDASPPQVLTFSTLP